jgi:gliding motility-associated-like protein
MKKIKNNPGFFIFLLLLVFALNQSLWANEKYHSALNRNVKPPNFYSLINYPFPGFASCPSPSINYTPTPPAIDQIIDGCWTNATPVLLSKLTTGSSIPGDFAGSRWRALYDNTNLYILVEVKDLTKKKDSPNWWDDDAVEIYIDGDHNGGTSYDINDFQFGFRWNDGTIRTGNGRVGMDTTGIMFRQTNLPGGYNMEIMIPWTTIGVPPVTNSLIGFDVAVDDDDNGGLREAQVSTYDTNNPGIAWTNPSVFGSLTLCNDRPGVTITKADGQGDPTSISPINFKAVFTEPVTGFDASDINLDGTAVPTLVVISGIGPEYNLSVSGMSSNGTVSVSINAGVCIDIDGNTNTSSVNTDNTVQYQLPPLDVSINQIVSQADPTNQFPIVFSAEFNRNVVDFSFDDISWSGTAGTITGNISGSGSSYTINVTGTSEDGTIIPNIAANIVHDVSSNGNTISTSTDNNVTYDSSKPSVEITLATGQLNPASSSPISFTATFSENVSGFNNSDVSLSGTAGATTVNITGGPKVYNIAISGMTSDGSIIIIIAQDVAVDAAGNNSTASINTINAVNLITSSFSITIEQSLGQSDPVNSFPIKFDVVFGRSVTDFTFDDIGWSGTAGAITGNITGGGSSYTINVTGTSSDGTIVPGLAANIVHDAISNSNTASTGTDNSVTYDFTKPSVEITLDALQQNPTNAAIISFDAGFSEPVTTFGNSNVQLTGTSGASTVYVRGGPQKFTIDISGMINPGDVTVNIPANVVTDLAGNYNTASTNTENTIYFDNVKADVTVTSSVSNPTGLTEIPVFFEFSKAVSGFEISDINISNASISNLTEVNPGKLWEAILIPISSGIINIQVSGDATVDEAGNGNNASNHFQIQFVEEEVTFEANNIFTPNSALNRFWNIKNINRYSDYQLIIKNSSGQEVYKTVNYQNNWNGTYNNNPLPTGTYYYFFSSPDKKTIYKGFINIIYE